jgi:hypothetical protein
MNLYVYWEYMEWIFLYLEYTEWIFTYTENTRNESVHILRIRGMNLYIYWEYAEWILSYTEHMRNAHQVEYFGEFETKI